MPTNTLFFYRGPWLAALLAAPATPAGPAQTAAPAPKVAYVRFWNMLPDLQKDTLQLSLAKNQLVTTTGASNTSAGYSALRPSTYTFSVARPGDHQVVKTPAVHLADGNFCTILATLKDGKIGLEVIDDTIDPKKDDGTARLTVRQYYPGISVNVTVGAASPLKLDYGQVTTFDHLPASAIPVAIQVALPDGSKKAMNATDDLAKGHHAELIFVADAYARFRTFFAVDGQTDLKIDPEPIPSPTPPASPRHHGSRHGKATPAAAGQ